MAAGHQAWGTHGEGEAAQSGLETELPDTSKRLPQPASWEQESEPGDWVPLGPKVRIQYEYQSPY